MAIHATSRTSTGHGQGKHAIPATYHTLLSAVRILVRSQSTSVCSLRCSSQGSHSHSNPAPTPNARLTSRAHTCDLRDTQRSDDSRCGNRRSTYMNNLRIDRVALPIAIRPWFKALHELGRPNSRARGPTHRPRERCTMNEDERERVKTYCGSPPR